ncbi:unnamed protein product, partial [Rotaria sp. Silwood2]
DMSYGTVGSPGPNSEIKLIDVPDTTYRTDMNQGEVCIRGPAIFKGELNSLIDLIFLRNSYVFVNK